MARNILCPFLVDVILAQVSYLGVYFLEWKVCLALKGIARHWNLLEMVMIMHCAGCTE